MEQMDRGIWKRWPFLRILLCQLSGIIFERELKFPTGGWLFLLLCSLSLLILFRLLSFALQYRLETARGLLIFFSVLALGGLMQKTTVPKITTNQKGPILIELKEKQKSTAKTIRYKAALYAVEEQRRSMTGHAYVYIRQSMHTPPGEGDVLLTSLSPRPIKKQINPGSFDFRSYAAGQGIAAQLFLSSEKNFILLKKQNTNNPFALSSIRNRILEALRATVLDPADLGLAEAMLIGYKEDLDKSLLNAYVATGVVHIIAISGLHLGIIFFLVDGLFRLLFRKKHAAFASLFITLPFIWTFALVSGASPSVNRSALMFSVMILAKVINRKSNSMNALLGSASILLAINPLQLTDLGFQLSYTALLSILLFEKKIKRLLFVQNKLLAYLWSMVTVTLAAQILTTPLVIFYFHRFPLLFLFTNLVAVPLSSLVLILEIGMVSLHAMGLNAHLFSAAMEKLMSLMNRYVLGMNSIPHTTLENIRISMGMLFLVCLLVFLLLAFFQHATKTKGYAVLTGAGLVILLRLGEQVALHHTQRMAVLDIPGHSCLVLQNGNQGMMVVSASLKNNTALLSKTIRETSMGWGIVHWQLRWLPETIVADDSNTLWKIQRWDKEAQRLPLRFYSTAAEGP